MVSIRYLFEVAEFSCLKSIPTAWVTSVTRTSGAVAPPVSIHTTPKGTVHAPACRHLRMVGLPEPAAADDPLRLLDDEEVVGRQVPERLLQPGRPDDLDGVHRGRPTESEAKAEVVLRIVAGAAHDLA